MSETESKLLTERDVALYLKVSTALLRKWRGQPETPQPPFVRLGGAIRYPLDGLDEFIKENTVQPRKAA